MLEFANDVAKLHFRDYHQAQDESIFIEFSATGVGNVCIVNLNFCLTSGFIKYVLNGQSQMSPRRVMMQRVVVREQNCQQPTILSLEIAFFKVMVPELQQLTHTSIDDLLPQSHVCREGWSSKSEKVVSVFDFPEGWTMVQNAFLSWPQMQLMAQKLGEFHGFSLKARHQKPEFGYESSFRRFTYPQSVNICEELRRCLPLLRNSRSQWPVTEESFEIGINQIELMLQFFHYQLWKAFKPNVANCWVLCHQNYCQTSVIFGPQQLRIFNWHSVGFASLAVDLVIMLFVEAAPEARNRAAYEQLVAIYRNAMVSRFNDIQVPSVDDILAQVKMCIPIALFVLANRVLQARDTARTVGSPTIWDENLIQNVYAYLIIEGFL